MGTRGLFGVVVDGQEKLSYNHWDSYPSALGVSFLTDLMGLTDQPEKFLQQARDLRVVSEQAKPTKVQAKRLERFANFGVGNGDDFYSYLRSLQGDLARSLEVGFVLDSRQFAYDSLFCEWAYVADLDAGTFEVYRGFQKSPPKSGRWSTPARLAAATRINNAYPHRQGDNRYYAVDCVAIWRLDNLPTEAELLALEERISADENARYEAEYATTS